MGAAKERRGDNAIRQEGADYANKTVSVTNAYLSGLFDQLSRWEKSAEENKAHAEKIEHDLSRANALISRLRAENAVLKDEKRKFIQVVEGTKRHISVAGNAHKKWAVTLVKARLVSAKLI